MAWIPLALQVLPLIPGFIESGVKLADAVMSDPAVSPEDKAALAEDLRSLNLRLQGLIDRVRASHFPHSSRG